MVFSEALSVKHVGDKDTYKEIYDKPNLVDLRDQLLDLLKRYNQYYNSTNKTRVSKTAQNLLYNLEGVTITLGRIHFLPKIHKTPKTAQNLLYNLEGVTITLGRIYFLPKIHKTPIALRPICAIKGTVTYAASIFLDLILQNSVENIPSLILNSSTLVKRLEASHYPLNYWLFEVDVDNLYPSIIVNEGLISNRKKLIQTTKPLFKIEFIIELAYWVLTNNYVKFGNRMFLQIIGTAMGTPFTVVFACIHQQVLEEKVLLTLRSEINA